MLPSLRGYRWLAWSLLIAVTVPRMTQRGLFVDGMVYAAVSRNLSIGVGSLWAPAFSATAYPVFYEHPPLGFAAEAAVFVLFGDHIFVEQVYSVLMLCLNGLLITALWRRWLPARYDWLPIIFWVVPSIVTWAAVNNMLENTQAVCTTAAVYALTRVAGYRSRGATLRWAAIAGLGVVAAVLVKGPVGFFPLAVPVLFLLLPANERPRHPWLVWVGLLGAVSLAMAALLTFEAPRHALGQFLDSQLLPSLRGDRESGGGSVAAVIRHLASGVVARMVVLLGILFLARRAKMTSLPHPAAWFFLAVGLVASVPLVITPKIMGHYFVPSVTFFALSAAAIALAIITPARVRSISWTRHIPSVLAGLLLVATVLVPILHGPIEPRDRNMLRFIDAIAPVIPRGATVGTCRSLELDWGLRAYLQRYLRVSIETSDAAANGWFLQYRMACTAPANCQPITGEPEMLLYACGAPDNPITR